MSSTLVLTRTLILRIVLPLLILAAASMLRFSNTRSFGEGPDEEITTAVVENLHRGDLRTNWKYVPHMPPPFNIDCYNFSSYLYFDAVAVGPHPRHLLRTERVVSAALGTLAVLLFYVFALRLFGDRVALSSMALTAVIPLLVQNAHYARPEAFVVCLSGAVFLLSSYLAQSRTSLTASVLTFASCFVCGFLVACKISLAPLFAVPLIALFTASRTSLKRVSLRLFSLAAIGLAAGIVLGVPDAVLHPDAYLSGYQMLRHQYANQHPPFSPLFAPTCSRLMVRYFYDSLGPLFCAGIPAGIAILLFKRRYYATALTVAPVVAYLGYFATQRTFFERNLDQIVPLMPILTALALVTFADAVAAAMPRLMPRAVGQFAPKAVGQSVSYAVIAALLAFTLAPPLAISRKFVWTALVTDPARRVVPYQLALGQTGAAPVIEPVTLLVFSQVDSLVARFEAAAGDLIVPVLDYGDEYTEASFQTLRRKVNAQKVGYFPSLFAPLFLNTITVYHSPNFRYVRLFCPDRVSRNGIPFVSRRLTSSVLAAPTQLGSWAIHAIPPGAPPLPAAFGEYYGSFTADRGDANSGRLTLGPIDVRGLSALGVPLFTGPTANQLSIRVQDHETGAVLAHIDLLPPYLTWAVWRAGLPPAVTLVDVVADDNGSGWGQWFAVGSPCRIAVP